MAKETWTIDPAHSAILFWVRHMVIAKVRGRFSRWSGIIEGDDSAPDSWSVQVRIEADSIDTIEPQRDSHLRSADFLDVERHREITFESTRVEGLDQGNYRVHGVTARPNHVGQCAWTNSR